MEAHRTQSPHLAKSQPAVAATSQQEKRQRIFRRGLHFVSITAMRWCKDHLFSVAVLLAVSVGLGMYYGAPPGTDTSPVPDDGYEQGTARSQSAPLRPLQPMANAAASSLPDFSEPLPPLVFAVASEEADTDPPLPIAVDHANTAQCVWLTGSIEPEEAKPDVIRNASRVHELTRPARNTSMTKPQ